MENLRFKMLLAADDNQPGGDITPPPVDPPADNKTPPTPPADNKPEVDLDYSKFDAKLDATIDPSDLSSKNFAAKAKELGISVEAAKDLYTTVGDSIVTSRSQYNEKAAERCEAALKEKWGDDFEVNNNALKRGALKLTEIDKDFRDELEQSGAFDNPLVARLMSKVGMMFKEDPQVHGSNATYDAKDPYGFAKQDKK